MTNEDLKGGTPLPFRNGEFRIKMIISTVKKINAANTVLSLALIVSAT